MPITEILSRNAKMYGQETCLTEINMDLQEKHNVTWLEYELIENNPAGEYRRSMTWGVFDEKANRMANLLLKRGIKKGDKVAILLMNCLEWLPIYFGILKTGAVAVPLNFRYTAEEIKYCLDLSDAIALIFGPEFIGRVESIYHQIPKVKTIFFAGENRPSFAENYDRLTANCSSEAPQIKLTDADDAAVYFSSGTTGFPKAILHTHRSLVSACFTEYKHHGQTREAAPDTGGAGHAAVHLRMSGRSRTNGSRRRALRPLPRGGRRADSRHRLRQRRPHPARGSRAPDVHGADRRLCARLRFRCADRRSGRARSRAV